MRRLLVVLLVGACGGGGGSDPPPRIDAGLPSGWLYTSGNHIYLSDGRVFHGRGANLHDTRSCDNCTYLPASADEVNRRADELIDVWGANFVRLVLESYANDGGFRVHWEGVVDDQMYLADIKTIV